jgi:hypothetical protein
MEERMSDPLERGLVYKGEAGVAWELRLAETQEPTGAETEKNERLLRVLSLFDEQGPERAEEEVEAVPELIRLETKLDLILELLFELVSTNEDKLRRVSIQLGAYGMEWEQDGLPPDIEDPVWVALRLDRRLPQPIRLPARVLVVQSKGSGHLVRVAFEHQRGELLELLEKFIFRQHRRQIAKMRANQQPRRP